MSFELVVHIPEVDCRRLVRFDPAMTAGELIDFIASRVEYLVAGDRFVLYCDTRRDRSQLYFPEHEVIGDSGVSSGDLIVLRHQPIDIAVVPDHTGGLTYPQAVSAPGRTVMRLDFYSPLCDSIGGISQRLGLQSSGQEYSFVCMNDRVSRPLKNHLSLAEQRVSPVGNTLLVQSANVLLKLTLESIVNVVKFGWLSKKSIKSEKTTKTKRRYCILTDSNFFYFKNNSPKGNPQGVIPLDYYQLVDKQLPTNQFMLQHAGESCFCSRLAHFVLSGETLDETDEWKMAIRDVCDFRPLFGVSLVEVGRANGGDVPALVRSCINELMAKAAETEGVFRLSGAQNEVEDLCAQYRRGRSPNLSGLSVHVVAGVLKQMLREMPNPLLTIELHDEFVAVAGKMINDDDEIDQLRDLVLRLPTIHRKCLDMLLRLLHLVDRHSDVTLMNSKNLAMSFTPSLLISSSRDPLPTREQLQVVGSLVTKYPQIFDDLPDMATEVWSGKLPPRQPSPPAPVAAPGAAAAAAAQLTRGPASISSPTVSSAQKVRGLSSPMLPNVSAGGALPPAPVVVSPLAATEKRLPPPSVATVSRSTGAAMASAASATSNKPGVRMSVAPGVVRPGVVKFAYTARSDKELSVAANTECMLLKEYPNGWTVVEIAGPKKGLVPTSYVEERGKSGAAAALPAAAAVAAAPAAAAAAAPAAAPTALSPTSLSLDLSSAGSVQRELEALRDMVLREQQRSDRLEEDLELMRQELRVVPELADDVAALRKDVEKVRAAVVRLSKERESAVNTESINALQEEIEVLDTRIEEEESARRGLEGALMGLVGQIQVDLADERDKVARLEDIVNAWAEN